MAWHYLDFGEACLAIDAARLQAAEVGQPHLAPPVPLKYCDRNTIEAALAAPAAGFGSHEQYPDLPSKAAVLLYTLAKSQACVDGNKRAALILVLVFLDQNYAELRADDKELATCIEVAAISSREDRDAVLDELTAWMTHAIASEPL